LSAVLDDRERRRTEADPHPVVGIHQGDRDGQLGKLLLVENSRGRFECLVRNASISEARNGFRSGERCLFLFVEDSAGFAPGGDEDEVFDG